jgi:hypothetical protein
MALSMFKITKGLQLDDIQILEGAGAPGASGDPSLAPVGSFYLDNTNGDSYTKILSGVGTNKWSKLAKSSDITSLGNAFVYYGTVVGGVDNTHALDVTTLSNTHAGDYYKVSTAGWFRVGTGTPFYANVNDGLVFNTASGVDIIDNTNSTVTGTANEISVSGSTDTGYTIGIDSAFVTRVSDLETSTGNLQTEVNNIEASAGPLVKSDGTFNVAGATFHNVTSPTSITNVLTQLDSAIGSGVTTDSIITSTNSVDANIQAISTYVESLTQTTSGTGGTSAVTDTVAAVMVKWLVYVQDNTTAADVSAFEVFAATNGTDVDFNQYGILSLGAAIDGLTVDVSLSTADLVLSVSTTNATTIKIKRLTAI